MELRANSIAMAKQTFSLVSFQILVHGSYNGKSVVVCSEWKTTTLEWFDRHDCNSSSCLNLVYVLHVPEV